MVTRPGKRLHNELERSTMLSMGESTISMTIFNSYVCLPGRVTVCLIVFRKLEQMVC